MARPTIWKLGQFRMMKVKVYSETFDRYKLVLKGCNKTIQQDLEEYINKKING